MILSVISSESRQYDCYIVINWIDHLRQNWSLQLKQQSMLLMFATLLPDILPSTPSQLKPLLIGRFSGMSQGNRFSL